MQGYGRDYRSSSRPGTDPVRVYSGRSRGSCHPARAPYLQKAEHLALIRDVRLAEAHDRHSSVCTLQNLQRTVVLSQQVPDVLVMHLQVARTQPPLPVSACALQSVLGKRRANEDGSLSRQEAQRY
jgi:hypothetical protein